MLAHPLVSINVAGVRKGKPSIMLYDISWGKFAEAQRNLCVVLRQKREKRGQLSLPSLKGDIEEHDPVKLGMEIRGNHWEAETRLESKLSRRGVFSVT